MKEGLNKAQREVHQRIEAEAEHSVQYPRWWHPEQYPGLWKLLESARREALARHRFRGRIVFHHDGQAYAARLTSMDRVIVENRRTGAFLASGSLFSR